MTRFPRGRRGHVQCHQLRQKFRKNKPVGLPHFSTQVFVHRMLPGRRNVNLLLRRRRSVVRHCYVILVSYYHSSQLHLSQQLGIRPNFLPFDVRWSHLTAAYWPTVYYNFVQLVWLIKILRLQRPDYSTVHRRSQRGSRGPTTPPQEVEKNFHNKFSLFTNWKLGQI